MNHHTYALELLKVWKPVDLNASLVSYIPLNVAKEVLFTIPSIRCALISTTVNLQHGRQTWVSLLLVVNLLEFLSLLSWFPMLAVRIKNRIHHTQVPRKYSTPFAPRRFLWVDCLLANRTNFPPTKCLLLVDILLGLKISVPFNPFAQLLVQSNVPT